MGKGRVNTARCKAEELSDAISLDVDGVSFFIENGGLRVDNAGPVAAKDVREQVIPWLLDLFSLPNRVATDAGVPRRGRR